MNKSFSPSVARAVSRPAVLVAAVAALAACAYVTQRKARRAESDNPPAGRFLHVDGVRLHYREYGDPGDPPLVLLHGNGSSSEEMALSGLPQRAALRYRVLSFDRPGYGHSDRPAGRRYDPSAQAALFLAALDQLDIRQPIVLAHSWATQVALQMAVLRPGALRALVLASGYYFPSLRFDVGPLGVQALPLLGPLLRHTVSPLLGRLLWPLAVRRIFSPAPTEEPFRSRYDPWMSLRPGTLQASSAEAAMMIPATLQLSRAWSALDIPTVLIAGRQDRLLFTRWHSQRLAQRLPRARLHVVDGAGHMVHHTATAEVARAIDEAAEMAAA